MLWTFFCLVVCTAQVNFLLLMYYISVGLLMAIVAILWLTDCIGMAISSQGNRLCATCANLSSPPSSDRKSGSLTRLALGNSSTACRPIQPLWDARWRTTSQTACAQSPRQEWVSVWWWGCFSAPVLCFCSVNLVSLANYRSPDRETTEMGYSW